MRKFRGADTEENQVLLAAIGDLLRAVFRNCHGIAGGHGERRFVADAHQAVTGLDYVPLEHGQPVQLGRDARLDTGSCQRNLWLIVAVQKLRDVTALAGPHFVLRFRFVAHLKDNTPIVVRGNRVNEAKIKATKDLLDLSGQTVLVTGASGNIGSAIAERLAEAGAAVIAHYFENEAAATALLGRLGSGELVQADLSDASAVEAMFASIKPSLVVNNAAAQPVTGLGDMTFAEWRAVMSANLDSAFLVTQRAALAWIKARQPGAIVNIASIEGLDPAPGHGHYATSKAGLTMLSRAAALEFGSAGIRINCVSPGLIDREGLARDWPDGVARWHDRVPLGRIGSAIDVADAVLFLLSPAARWISGANLVVDGGMSTQSKW